VKHLMGILSIALIAFLVSLPIAASKPTMKTKFYNFDDLLIDGKVQKPQVLYTDARQKVKFSRLLKLKKDFISKLHDSRKDPGLR